MGISSKLQFRHSGIYAAQCLFRHVLLLLLLLLRVAGCCCCLSIHATVQRSRSSCQPRPHSLSSSSIHRPLPISRRHVGVSAAASPAELQQMLAAKELELAAMFESGRPMPQVGQQQGLLVV